MTQKMPLDLTVHYKPLLWGPTSHYKPYGPTGLTVLYKLLRKPRALKAVCSIPLKSVPVCSFQTAHRDPPQRTKVCKTLK